MFNLLPINWTRTLSVLLAGGFILCYDLCTVPHSQCDCIPETNMIQSKKNNIMQQRHVYSVAGTTGSVWVTLQTKQRRREWGGAGCGLVAMGACISRAKPRWFDWGPWQWTALTFDPVQAVSLCHSQMHLRGPRADCPEIVLDLLEFFFVKWKSSLGSSALPSKRPYVCDQWCRYLGVNYLIHADGWLDF